VRKRREFLFKKVACLQNFLKIDGISLSEIVQKGMLIQRTRDPFDRLIIAQAMAKSYPLLTKDDKILSYFSSLVKNIYINCFKYLIIKKVDLLFIF